ncbi:MAG: CBS domain-containing protein [Bdellovibrionales bacterium]|nr:CBS domain-containing protein [Bdellovibrionales bacterium]
MVYFESYSLNNFVSKEALIVCEPTTSATKIYEIMQKSRIRHLPVVVDGKAIGVLSDRDVQFVSAWTSDGELTAKDLMTPDPYSVPSTADLKEVVQEMSKKRINSVLIHDEKSRIVGIFTSTDALDLLAKVI